MILCTRARTLVERETQMQSGFCKYSLAICNILVEAKERIDKWEKGKSSLALHVHHQNCFLRVWFL